MTPAIDRSLVDRLADLATLELTDAEAESLVRDLSKILAYVAVLEELDTTGVPPLPSVAADRAPLRPDEPAESLARDVALGQAPRTTEGGFAVPRFVDEG
jgi:aspartyl-tRNA(Asn)/glutamyl-tRNA(Gln) amidotransferase subunit C